MIGLRTLFVSFCCLFVSTFFGFDNLSELKKDSVNSKYKIKLHFALDARRGKLLNQQVKFNGLLLGIQIKNKMRCGIGFHNLSNTIRFVGEIDKTKFPDASDTLFFDFAQLSLYYDHVWFYNKRWEVSTPVFMGIGGFSLRYKLLSQNASAPYIEGGTLITNFGGHVQFKIFRWFGLGIGYGYRTPLRADKNIRTALNGGYTQFQIKIFFGEIYNMIFKPETLEPWREKKDEK